MPENLCWTRQDDTPTWKIGEPLLVPFEVQVQVPSVSVVTDVLLVEDEAIVLLDMQESLVEAGHTVMTESNVEEAILAMEQHPNHFTMLVTDYNMPPPSLTGADLIEHMRESYPSIPVVLVSAKPHPVTAEFQSKYHVHMISKPYANDILVRIVGQLLTAS